LIAENARLVRHERASKPRVIGGEHGEREALPRELANLALEKRFLGAKDPDFRGRRAKSFMERSDATKELRNRLRLAGERPPAFDASDPRRHWSNSRQSAIA
jgi:hypothetical protein